MTLHARVKKALTSVLGQAGPDQAVLCQALRLLAKYRSTLIQNALIEKYGARVLGGPFAGMEFCGASAEGCYAPKLLGCYEAELHGFWASARGGDYDTVLNIGCAEGYYAIGLARMLPSVRVFAYDTNPTAQAACRMLAERNGVTVIVGGRFGGGDFAAFGGKRVLLVCDIEGEEDRLLDPMAYPVLAEMDIVVELHPLPTGHAMSVVPPRFSATHDISIVKAEGRDAPLPGLFEDLDDLDRLLAVWEWRAVPTPWAIMRRKPRLS